MRSTCNILGSITSMFRRLTASSSHINFQRGAILRYWGQCTQLIMSCRDCSTALPVLFSPSGLTPGATFALFFFTPIPSFVALAPVPVSSGLFLLITPTCGSPRALSSRSNIAATFVTHRVLILGVGSHSLSLSSGARGLCGVHTWLLSRGLRLRLPTFLCRLLRRRDNRVAV